MAVEILSAAPDAAARDRRRSRLLAAIVVIVLWGLITHGTSAGTGDEPHYEMITHSLAFDHDMDLTTDYENPGNRALFGHYEAGTHVQPGKDGRLRPVHDVGMPLLFAPYYAAAYELTAQIVAHAPASWLARARLDFTVLLRHFLSLAMIAMTAWMAVGLLGVFSTLSASPWRAFAWTLLLVLSPPILSHSFLFFTEIVSASIGLAVFRWLRRNPRSRAQALVAGAATGYLLLVHARNAGLIAGLVALALIESRRWRDRGLIAAFMAGAAATLMLRTGINYHFWGTWITTPHERFGGAAGWRPFVAESATRLTAWLFDQEYGLLPYAPIYLLAPAGWLALWKRDRRLCAAISLVVASYVALIALPTINVHGWQSGWSPAARYLMPIAPFLAILVFAAVADARRWTAAVAIVAAAQVCVDALLWQHPKLLWNNGTGTSALFQFLDRGAGWLSSSAPSFVRPLDGATVSVVCAASIVWLALTLSLRSRRPGFRNPGSPVRNRS